MPVPSMGFTLWPSALSGSFHEGTHHHGEDGAQRQAGRAWLRHRSHTRFRADLGLHDISNDTTASYILTSRIVSGNSHGHGHGDGDRHRDGHGHGDRHGDRHRDGH
jgi:hypothetical protein